MAEELRIVFMVLGLLAIVALVVHGFYTVRKNKQIPKEEDLDANSNMGADDDIEYVSKARVISGGNNGSDKAEKTEIQDESVFSSSEPQADTDKLSGFKESLNKTKKFSFKDGINRIKPEKKATQRTRVEPEIEATQLQMNLPEDNVADQDITADDEDVDISEQLLARESSSTQSANTEQSAGASESAAESVAEKPVSDEKPSTQPQEVLILNVVAPEGQLMSGAVLLPTLLTLGFKFGEFNIFHRHQDESGSGDVLFSLANMFNPGTFDIDNIEQFTTQGVSLFLSLPVNADSTATFNMMHNAAKKIAAEFDGQVLDGQRNLLTGQTVQHYIERIREFERRQLIKS
ncbi:cell division protein ZipA [Catenovulum adriaticum]|uniref:Cell division protein ZipA n=1 Tax=Catenovulum adriaticum TaxID=2984846 RepID=A0ABY7AP59_9ALTE|nr:cell division protein ZipA [Catenovulum sp. TS8]WAJ71354.1 cell division protein ZipA [Catenovulum sp. TS8]